MFLQQNKKTFYLTNHLLPAILGSHADLVVIVSEYSQKKSNKTKINFRSTNLISAQNYFKYHLNSAHGEISREGGLGDGNDDHLDDHGGGDDDVGHQPEWQPGQGVPQRATNRWRGQGGSQQPDDDHYHDQDHRHRHHHGYPVYSHQLGICHVLCVIIPPHILIIITSAIIINLW